MGLLKILAWGSSKAKPQANDVQTRLDRPFQETQGAPKHGPDVQGTIEPSPQSQVFLSQSDPIDMEAPAPFVPRFRRYDAPERPRTPVRLKRDPRRPPVAFRKHSSLASLSTAYKNSAPSEERKSNLESLEGPRGRSGSLSSIGSQRFKDLLDAQEEIRPTDFRRRVEAAGARDYGEDVADRNIAQSRGTSPDLRRPYTSGTGRPFSQLGRPKPLLSSTRTNSFNSSISPNLKSSYNTRLFLDFSSPETSPTTGSGDETISRRNRKRLSWNTYIPSGLESPSAPHSAAASLRLPEEVASIDFATHPARPKSPPRHPLQLKKSPTGSNLSVPGSPRVIQHSVSDQDTSLADRGDSDLDARIREAEPPDDIVRSYTPSRQQTSSTSIGYGSFSKAAGRCSHQTPRSPLSSVTSRYSSLEVTPLGYPQSRIDVSTGPKGLSDSDGAPNGRTQYTYSRPHSRSSSSEEAHGYYRGKSSSLLSSPLGLKHVAEVYEHEAVPRSSIRHWSLSTTSNSDSTATSGPFSRGSGWTESRRTKSTSVGSTNRALSSRKSEESIASASNGHRATSSGWSPATTRSTVFNFDDYVSSDDDSFTTARKTRHPTAEGEEELLFRPGYGITGAALPGLLEMEGDGACSPPTVRMRDSRSSSLTSCGSAAAVAGPKDNRFSQISMDRDIPRTLLDLWSNPPLLPLGTFGRGSKRPNGHERKDSTSSTSVGENEEVHSSVEKDECSTRHTSSSATIASDTWMYEDMLTPRRGLKHISALGKPYGRNMPPLTADAKAAAREESNKVDINAAIRLRKETKARKRAEGAKSIKERRATRGFDDLKDEAMLISEGKGEVQEGRGRRKTRDIEWKGKAMAFK